MKWNNRPRNKETKVLKNTLHIKTECRLPINSTQKSRYPPFEEEKYTFSSNSVRTKFKMGANVNMNCYCWNARAKHRENPSGHRHRNKHSEKDSVRKSNKSLGGYEDTATKLWVEGKPVQLLQKQKARLKDKYHDSVICKNVDLK